jgi:hypothetical protein
LSGSEGLKPTSRFVALPRLASLGGADGGVRHTGYFRARRRILEVKALPWHAVKVGLGWKESITLFTT